jgi:hypothetical protein
MHALRFAGAAVVAGVLATVLTLGALAAGPTPGTVTGADGIAEPAGQFRFVAVTSSRDTVVQKIATQSGRVLRFAAIRGVYGVPLVSYDGTATGLAHDGRSLVLSTFPVPTSKFTRFAIFDARTLKLRQRLALPGLWSLDALSPDGRTLFLIEYISKNNYTNYRVRAYDLTAGRLVAGAIVDKREPEAMTGLPMTRVSSEDASWAYTLYSRDTASAFVHALDTVNRAAVCIDLPWTARPDSLLNVRMSIEAGALVLMQPGTGRLATVDLKTYKVNALRAPVANGQP